MTTGAQADPGKGAVVIHADRDATGGGWYAVTPDGQLRLDVATTGQSEFVCHNPDGTWTLESVEPQAPVTVSVRNDRGDWMPRWFGPGSLRIAGLVEPVGDGIYDFTDEAVTLHIEGQLTSLLDGSSWSLLVTAVIVNYEFKELKIDLQPR